MEKTKIPFSEFSRITTEYAYAHDLPGTGCFELTPLCNLDCKMCYVHLQDPSVKERMLSGEQWISLMQDAIDEGMISAMLTGGEAMTHPDFWDIYSYLINHGITVRIKTNGVLLTGDAIERFSQYPPVAIDVSLYGCNSESYLAVTGFDVYQTVCDNIRNAIDAGLNIQLSITPSSFLSPWIEETMKQAKTFDVSVLVNEKLLEPNENTGRHKANFELEPEEYQDIIAEKDRIFLPDDKSEDRKTSDTLNRPHVAPKGLFCNAGRTGFAINWDGVMIPCLSFPRKAVSSDAVLNGFKKAWAEINSGVKNYAVPKQCHSCSYNERCHYCPPHHGKMAEKHLCDPAECEYKKRRIDLYTASKAAGRECEDA